MNEIEVRYFVNESAEYNVGLEVKIGEKKNVLEVHLPIGYSKEEISNQDIKRILKLIAKQENRDIEKQKKQNMFPILIAEKIIQNFLQYGLYKEKEEVVDLHSKGKINWKKTINYKQPFLNNKIIYANIFRKHTNYFIEGQVQEIQKWCLSYISKVVGIFFSFRYPNVNLNYGKKQMISILENALSQTNQDEQLETLKLLKDFIKQVNFLEVEENHTGIKSHRFEYVWQDLIDTIGIEDKYKYLPQAQYYNLEDKPFNYSVKPLLPDTIVEGQNGKIYVLDAKYYRIGHLPDQYNIFKQVRYGEYVNIVSGRKDIINAFVLPANLGPNNIAVKGYAKLEKSNSNNDYEKILVCYVDTKSLIAEPEAVMQKVLEKMNWKNIYVRIESIFMKIYKYKN